MLPIHLIHDAGEASTTLTIIQTGTMRGMTRVDVVCNSCSAKHVVCINDDKYLEPGEVYLFTCPTTSNQVRFVVPPSLGDAYIMEVDCEEGDIEATLQ